MRHCNDDHGRDNDPAVHGNIYEPQEGKQQAYFKAPYAYYITSCPLTLEIIG